MAKHESKFPPKPAYYIWLAKKYGKEMAKAAYEMYLFFGIIEHGYKGQ
jgi:hypothetical protein